MNRFVKLASVAVLLLVSASAFAAAFSVVPNISFPSTLKPGQVVSAQYSITNIAPDNRTLLVRNIVLPEGVVLNAATSTCTAVPFTLTKGETCNLALQYKGKNVGQHVQGGPQVCNDDFNCNIPLAGQEINLHVVDGNLLGELRFQLMNDQHLQARALTVTNASKTDDVTLPENLVTVSSNLQNKLIVCKADGSNCDRPSTCDAQVLAPGASCQIWLHAQATNDPLATPVENAPAALGITQGTITVAGATVFNVQYGLDLYAGIDSPNATDNLSRFDGHQWTNISLSSVDPKNHGKTESLLTTKSLAIYNDDLFIGGRPNYVLQPQPTNLIRWNGVSYSAINSTKETYNNTIAAMIVYNNHLITQRSYSTDTSNTLAAYDSSQWYQLGKVLTTAPRPQVSQLINDEKYGLCAASGILNGSSFGVVCLNTASGDWKVMGTNFNDGTFMLSALTSYNDSLYVVSSNGQGLANVFSFDGTSWQAMNIDGVDGNHLAANTGAIAEVNGKLYMGVNGTQSGGYSTLQLDSTNHTWEKMSVNTLGGPVTAMYSFNGSLYAAGNFRNTVAYFDFLKEQWMGIELTTPGTIRALLIAPRIASITEATH